MKKISRLEVTNDDPSQNKFLRHSTCSNGKNPLFQPSNKFTSMLLTLKRGARNQNDYSNVHLPYPVLREFHSYETTTNTGELIASTLPDTCSKLPFKTFILVPWLFRLLPVLIWKLKIVWLQNTAVIGGWENTFPNGSGRNL